MKKMAGRRSGSRPIREIIVRERPADQDSVGKARERVMGGLVQELAGGQLPLGDAAELGAHLGEEIEQRRIRLLPAVGEELEYADDFASRENRKGHGAADPEPMRDPGPGQRGVGAEVRNPDRLTSRQDPPRQSGARGQAQLPGALAEILEAFDLTSPDVGRDERAIGLNEPRVPECPSAMLADGLDRELDHRLDRARLVGRVGDRREHHQPLLLVVELSRHSLGDLLRGAAGRALAGEPALEALCGFGLQSGRRRAGSLHYAAEISIRQSLVSPLHAFVLGDRNRVLVEVPGADQQAFREEAELPRRPVIHQQAIG